MLSKIRTVSIVMVALCFLSCTKEKAKTVTSADIYNRFSVNHHASYFNVPPGMVSLFLDESKKGNKELKDLLGDVGHLSFLIVNKTCNTDKNCLSYRELNEKLDSINFYDLAQIKNGKEIINVKVDKNRKHFNELVILVSNQDALYCISFKGKISSKKVVNLVKPENIAAITNLDRFKQ